MNQAVVILTILDVLIRNIIIPAIFGVLIYKLYEVKKKQYKKELRDKKYNSLTVDRYCH